MWMWGRCGSGCLDRSSGGRSLLKHVGFIRVTARGLLRGSSFLMPGFIPPSRQKRAKSSKEMTWVGTSLLTCAKEGGRDEEFLAFWELLGAWECQVASG